MHLPAVITDHFSLALASVALALVAVTLATAQGISPAKAEGINRELIYKKLTKAECLKKPGYIWIEASGRCVRDTRGSH